MRGRTYLFAIATTLAARSALSALPTPASTPATAPTTAAADFRNQFDVIRAQLASPDFSRRQAGQKLLDAIPVTEVEALRALAEAEPDAEVRTHLESRVDAMDLHAALHPPGLSLHLKDARLEDLCDAMTRELGGQLRVFAGEYRGRGAPKAISIQCDNQPFVEVLNRLTQQVPIGIDFPDASRRTNPNGDARLTAGEGRTDYHPDAYTAVQSFGLWPHSQMSGIGRPPADRVLNWMLMVDVVTDPRVRVAEFSQLLVNKMTDQNGADVTPLVRNQAVTMSSFQSPTSKWESVATVNGSPTLTRIKELHGSIEVTVLARPKTTSLDLNKEIKGVTVAGQQVAIEKGIEGITLRLLELPDAAANVKPRPLYVRAQAFDGRETLLGTMETTLPMLTRGGASFGPLAGQPAKITISWWDKAVPMTIPVDLENIQMLNVKVPEAPAPN